MRPELTERLWGVLATKDTYIRIYDNRDHYIPSWDIEQFRRHVNGNIGLCPRRTNATDGQAAAPCVWVHYTDPPQKRLPSRPALIIRHGPRLRTAIWWLTRPLPVTAHPDDDWLRKANLRLHYHLTGQQSVAPSTSPLWLMPAGGELADHWPDMVDPAFLTRLKPSPWERNAHKRPARQH